MPLKFHQFGSRHNGTRNKNGAPGGMEAYGIKRLEDGKWSVIWSTVNQQLLSLNEGGIYILPQPALREKSVHVILGKRIILISWCHFCRMLASMVFKSTPEYLNTAPDSRQGYNDWLTDWLNDWLTWWLTDLMADWLTNWLNELIDWLTNWQTELMIDWLT